MAEKNKKETCVVLIHNVPEELKRKFKAKCAEKGISMENAFVDLMKKFSK
ncbi:MAG: hypothetical protein ACTSO3_00960 [Candidatus Heimdallarchaeaceae archaeon]